MNPNYKTCIPRAKIIQLGKESWELKNSLATALVPPTGFLWE